MPGSLQPTPIQSPTAGGAGAFCIKLQNKKKVLKKHLTTLENCDKIVNCIKIACSMGISAF